MNFLQPKQIQFVLYLPDTLDKTQFVQLIETIILFTQNATGQATVGNPPSSLACSLLSAAFGEPAGRLAQAATVVPAQAGQDRVQHDLRPLRQQQRLVRSKVFKRKLRLLTMLFGNQLVVLKSLMFFLSC